MEISQIGPYQIVTKLDEGGMGIVYKAVDPATERIVAIKTLKDSVDSQTETFLRFKKEAELLEKLKHSNILEFIDFIEKEGQLFIITEYLQGKTLKEIIQEGFLNFEERAELLLQVAEALDYVHSEGIIHRDMKPSNVMVCNDRKVKILDFGVANLMNFQKLFSSQQGVAGSFSYMSPEQSGILKRNIDNRSDLYSLGILAYHLITGKLPYQAKEVGELIHQHIAKIPEDPINICPGLSPILNKIILKLMKKDPDDRYQTAYGLAEDLRIYHDLNQEQKKNFYLELGKKDRLKNLNYRTRLVGRKKEMQHLLNHLNNTLLGKGFVTAIIGKSGMGKSRLVSELQKYTGTKNALYVYTVSSEREQNHPYLPFIKVVKKILDLIGKFGSERRNIIYGELKSKLGADGVILSKLIPECESIFGVFQPGKKFLKKENEVFFEKLKDFFSTVASPALPIIICFDDVHFWDQGSVQFFDYLKDYLEATSINMVLSIREESIFNVRELHKILTAEAKEGRASFLNLRHLNSDEVESLAREVFGDVYSGINELSARLNESTQGNPLLIIENIKTLVEEQVMVQKNDGWEVVLDKLSDFHFSSSIIDKILGRLEQAQGETREILTVASVLGKDFSFQILYQILSKENGEISPDLLLEHLKKGVKAQLLNETFSEKGEIVYSFTHDKVPESLMTQVQESTLKSIHRKAAEIIEEKYDGSDREYKLAFHYLMGDRRNKAYHYNLKAGEKAVDSFSYKLAVSFFDHALEILRRFAKKTAKGIRSRIDLGLKIVNYNFQLGELKKNISLLKELALLAEEVESQKSLAEIYYLSGKNHYFSGDQASAMEFYRKVIPIAEELKLPELLAIPYCAIGRGSCYIAKFQDSIEYIKKGIELLPESEELEWIYSLGILGQSYGALGKRKEAMDAVKTLRAKYGDAKNELYRLYIQFFYGSVASQVGNPVEAVDECLKAYEMAREMKNPSVELNALFNLGRSYMAQGKWEQGVKSISRGIAIAEEHKVYVGLFMLFFYLAEAYAHLGNVKIAKETLNKGKSYVGISEPFYAMQWEKRLLALFELYSGAPDLYQALELSEGALEEISKAGESYAFLEAQHRAVRSALYWKMEKNSEAEQESSRAQEIFRTLGARNDLKQLEQLKDRFMSKGLHNQQGSLNKQFEITSTHTMTATQTEFSYQRQLSYLLKLSEQLARVHVMDELLPCIMSLSIEVSGAERGILFLYKNPDDEKLELEIKAQKSIDGSGEEGGLAYSALALEKTLASKKGQLVMDAEKELPEDSQVIEHNMKSIITVPLMTSGKVLGAIYLDNRQVKGLFTEENFELLKAFAIEAAISIENAKLYEQVQEKARIEQEMEIAKDIQTSILPFISDTEHYEIGAFMRTATEVGGDYYDFFLEEEPYFGVFGDVSGHGLKSGLVMMMAEVAFNTLMTHKAMREEKLELLYQQINKTLYNNIQERLSKKSKIGRQYSHMYMTFRMFRFNGEGNFEMFGNDHAEPFICRADTGEVEAIRSTGFLLGIMEDAMLNNESYSFQLNRGDLLVLYSDGISEAKSQAKRKDSSREEVRNMMFGEERLFEVVGKNREKRPEEIISAVIEAVDSWMEEQEDDITLAIIKKK